MIRHTLYIVLKTIYVITIIQDMNFIQYLDICIGQWMPCWKIYSTLGTFFTQSERLICLTYILGLTGFAGLVIDYLLWKTT